MLKDQVAIVTGASRGIGKEIARQLAKQGVKLSIMGSSEEVHRTKREIEAEGHSDIFSFRADVTKENEVDHVIEATKNAFGSLDILINNAGVVISKKIKDITVEEWRKTFEVNVQGVFLCTKAVVPIMKQQQSGTIITISSDVARYAIAEMGSLYTSTQYAVQGFIASIGQELKGDGIRVGTINPGLVNTNFGAIQGNEQGGEKKDWLKVEDIADAVIYMAGAPKHMLIDELYLHPLSQKYPRT
ncbi:SDR family oxidoreductase [Sediminibacillus albus]|uniref:NADP-dependent 3-hydroxy acid dehydrogenase YdfG n=1 Tax=Sediminibacillus albus TaxID=407036 RepID=A0A1G9CBG5_9BACI|nr:SDR family oxidoreductase [Sediminibacillus albus]SDK48969.1 NADP-dependent 3-hydroxy acid dehydrogenase YdfG [Sediminibacillus albus]